MKSKAIVKHIIATTLVILLIFIGICLGILHGFNRGYEEGQKATNSWWIDKQSRYYDSVEVEKRRHSNSLDTF
jgi:tetrahydromethanopterin S-methyltransferase subunit C